MRQEIDVDAIKRTHAALYRPTDLVPVDGDDMTWDDMPEESTQPWQEHIMERLAALERELAELRTKLQRWEADS